MKWGIFMKIWLLNFELDKYDNLEPINEITIDEIQTFDGRSHVKDWRVLPVQRLEPEKRLELSDAPGFFIPVFSRRALECLKPLIDKNVEFLPLDFKENEYYGINVITVLDAINYERSIYKTFSDGKKIMRFKKYAFLTEVVDGIPIFKITDERKRWSFVSEEFKQVVEENHLTGFIFKLIWDSEKEIR